MTIQAIEKFIEDFSKENNNDLEYLEKNSEDVIRKSSDLFDSWSGSYTGWHGLMYYKNFEIPKLSEKFSGEWGAIRGMPDGWVKKTPEEVREKIQEGASENFSLSTLEKSYENIKEKAKSFRYELVTNLQTLEINSSTDIKTLISEIEKHPLGVGKNKFLKKQIPSNVMTRDREALSEGVCIPSHVYYQALGYGAKSLISDLNQIVKIAQRAFAIVKATSQEYKGGEAESGDNPPVKNVHSSLEHLLKSLNKPLFVSKPDHRDCKEWVSDAIAAMLRFDGDTAAMFAENSKYLDEKLDESTRRNYLNLMERQLRNATKGVTEGDLKFSTSSIQKSQKILDEIPMTEKITKLINEVNSIENKPNVPNLLVHQLRTILWLVLIYWWENKNKKILEAKIKESLKKLIKHSINKSNDAKLNNSKGVVELLNRVETYKTLSDTVIHDEFTMAEDLEIQQYTTNIKAIISFVNR